MESENEVKNCYVIVNGDTIEFEKELDSKIALYRKYHLNYKIDFRTDPEFLYALIYKV